MGLIAGTASYVVPLLADAPTPSSAAANRSDPDQVPKSGNTISPDRDEMSATSDQKIAKTESPPRELLSGRVILLQDALKSRGVKAYAEMKDQAVLETESGELIPLVSDWRGRAFFQDKRLRDRKVDLVGMRRPGIPYFQVLMIFTFDESGDRQYMDYWCDICSIPMYEIKPCDCCQADIRLRFQPRDLPEYVRHPNTETEKTKGDEKPR
jgi:hypothetical protein